MTGQVRLHTPSKSLFWHIRRLLVSLSQTSITKTSVEAPLQHALRSCYQQRRACSCILPLRAHHRSPVHPHERKAFVITAALRPPPKSSFDILGRLLHSPPPVEVVAVSLLSKLCCNCSVSVRVRLAGQLALYTTPSIRRYRVLTWILWCQLEQSHTHVHIFKPRHLAPKPVAPSLIASQHYFPSQRSFCSSSS